LLGVIGNEATIVFCNHREALERISTFLKRYKVTHDLYHGKLEQEERERALIKFRNGSNLILVTTDLAARGLDISQVRHVVHYQLPVNEQSFIHRNGRTARMNAEGTAYLIMSPKETVPPYISSEPEAMELPDTLELPAAPEWTTVYIGAGKKEKVNKVDIVGWLLQKGKLEKSELGMINVGDHISYAAVNSSKVKEMLQLVRAEKLKTKAVKIDIAR
jgi:ATP-independent RNA helicase DbpA